MRRLALVVALVVACAHAPAAKPAAKAAPLRVADFYPLKVGERWTYEVRGRGQVATRTVSIVREQGGYFEDDQHGALKIDARGLRDRDRYLLEAPLEAGHEWSSVLSVEAIERYEIVEAGRPCQAKAGTWARCVVVRGSMRQNKHVTLVNEWTYAEGTGLVHLVSAVSVDKQPAVPQVELELVDFHRG